MWLEAGVITRGQGVPPTKYGREKHENSSRFRTTFELIANITERAEWKWSTWRKFENCVINYEPSPIGRKKLSNFGPQTKTLQALTLTNPSALSSGDYISALRRRWPLKLSHVLEIHQGLLAHITINNRDRGPQKKFKGEYLTLYPIEC